ncbi:MAG: hypothetical protein AB4368_22335 [Xenococcaceae cyanobacterium]
MNFSKVFNLLLLLIFGAFALLPHQEANIKFSVYFSWRSPYLKSDRQK